MGWSNKSGEFDHALIGMGLDAVDMNILESVLSESLSVTSSLELYVVFHKTLNKCYIFQIIHSIKVTTNYFNSQLTVQCSVLFDGQTSALALMKKMAKLPPVHPSAAFPTQSFLEFIVPTSLLLLLNLRS